MIRRPLFLLLFCISYYSFGQITVKNQTEKKITNLYIVECDSTLKTKGYCEFIENKNLLKSKISGKRQATIPVKLNPYKFYNLICFDTTEYPPLYNDLMFKYYFSGKVTQVTLDTSNIEKDFRGHCTEGIAEPNYEDYKIDVVNNSKSNLIKLYYRFDKNESFTRHNDFFQWTPVGKGQERQITLYNLKPKEAQKLYLKYFTENKGKFIESDVEIDLISHPSYTTLKIE